MKSNTFNYSLLAVGVAALMGVAGTANAAQPSGDSAAAPIPINNVASATYLVTGTTQQQTSTSNIVTVNVTETGAFTLLATSTPADDTNENLTINPQANQSATFIHTLQNNGNITDTYSITLDDEDTNDNFDYSSYTITYTTDSGQTGTITSGQTITLAKNEIATITIVATSNIARTVNQNGIFTVTASSQYLEGRGGAATTYQAVNTDNALTKTPIFAITKSANTNLNNNVFDAGNTGAYIDYTIVIKNEGNAAASAFNIVDRLPLGLVIDTTVAPTVGGTALTAGQFTTSADGRTLTITDQDLAINADLTVTLRAIKDANQTIATDAVLLNVAEVQDDTLNNDGITNADLIDRSDDQVADENNYEGNSGLGVDNDDDASVTTRNQLRNITITNPINQEIPLLSANNIYTYTIANEGTDITEADATGEVFFTVAPTTAIDQITIERVFVDTNSDGVFDAADGDIELTANGGNYDLNQAVPAGLAPNANVKISVQLSSNGVSNNTTNVNNIGAQEVMAINVTAQTPVDGTAVPAVATATNTTTLQGLNLTKAQAVASCTSPGTLTYVSTNLTGEPGQCIYYRLTAKNTFTETAKVLKTVAITDDIDTTRVTYDTANYSSVTDGGSAGATQAYDTTNSVITATFAELKASETGTVDFKTTISATGKITP